MSYVIENTSGNYWCESNNCFVGTVYAATEYESLEDLPGFLWDDDGNEYEGDTFDDNPADIQYYSEFSNSPFATARKV